MGTKFEIESIDSIRWFGLSKCFVTSSTDGVVAIYHLIKLVLIAGPQVSMIDISKNDELTQLRPRRQENTDTYRLEKDPIVL